MNMKRHIHNFDSFRINESISEGTIEGTMPPGEYWIGDLCYVMNDKWGSFCDATITGDSVMSGQVDVDGATVVTLTTAYGDGTYRDGQGHEYGVDAGLIGAIRVEDITDPKARLDWGRVVNFDAPWYFESDNGVLTFGDIVINTGDEDEDDEDRWDYDDEDQDGEYY
jgi:hypothetical protein